MNSFWKPHSSFWFRNHSLQITAYSSCWNKHHCMVQCMQQVSFCGGKQDDTLRRSQLWQLEAWPACSQWSEGLRSELNYAVGKSVCLQEFRQSRFDYIQWRYTDWNGSVLLYRWRIRLQPVFYWRKISRQRIRIWSSRARSSGNAKRRGL